MRIRGAITAAAVIILGLWAWNTSLFAERPASPEIKLISHRGVHQTFSRKGLNSETCTAERIHPPDHQFLENTIPSMRAAFAAGAEAVEIDVHLTRDNQFAVFHDWTLDCRTEGSGVTHEHEMATLKALDIGYGYTADDGKTFPLRGTGTGQMPTLEEVLRAFPDGKFLINFKSTRKEEGDALAALLKSSSEWRETIFGVYGGEPPTRRSLELIENLRGYDKSSTKGCLISYLAYGWTGIVPGNCQNTYIVVPANYAWLLWGWPHRFTQRVRDAGSEVILMGDYSGGEGTVGIDSIDELEKIPEGFDGYVWTNRIEVIGPALGAKQTAIGRPH